MFFLERLCAAQVYLSLPTLDASPRLQRLESSPAAFHRFCASVQAASCPRAPSPADALPGGALLGRPLADVQGSPDRWHTGDEGRAWALFASVGELRRALVDGAMRVIRAIRGARASRAGRIDRNSQRQTVLATEEGRRRAICHLDNPRALACSHVHRSLPSSSIGSPAARRSAERHVLIGLFTS